MVRIFTSSILTGILIPVIDSSIRKEVCRGFSCQSKDEKALDRSEAKII